MATSTKVSFRARALDANKPMYVYYTSELPDISECAPIARAVTQMPTGMEKEEEMESHLQDAMLAQQASTSGERSENHFIPTPKVVTVPEEHYRSIYVPQPPPPKNQYLKVQAWLSLEKEEPDYDLDSEDEGWLSQRPHIDSRTLERIFDTLEAQSSEVNICQPATARSVLTAFDEGVVDDVYDYWLAKRTKAMKSRPQFGIGGLIPRVRTECRKDAQGAVNPYVAFRRRAEKMQTRKNRKNDEDSYEKVLKLSHDLRKAVTLFDMVKRREKTKMALIDLDSDILSRRMLVDDFGSSIYNQFVLKCRPEPKYITEEPNKKKIKRARTKLRPSISSLDREVPNKAWLKKNAEVWNRPPLLSGSSGVSPVVEVQLGAQAVNDANADGRYTFKRRRGCVYRAHLARPIEPEVSSVPIEHRLFHVSLPSTSGKIRPHELVRRRIGRGGRVVYDRVGTAPEPRVPRVYDPFDTDYVIDSTTSFRASFLIETSDVENDVGTDRRFSPDYAEQERRWLNSYNVKPDDPPPDPNSGNGQAGRVDSKVTKCGEVPVATDDWRDGSGSPSESNSSVEWTPSLGARIAAFALISNEEEARTGEHPVALQPALKESAIAVGSTVLKRSSYILAPPSVGS